VVGVPRRRHPRILAIDDERVLNEVVRTDRKKVDFSGELDRGDRERLDSIAEQVRILATGLGSE
jgi:hypothetical protein